MMNFGSMSGWGMGFWWIGGLVMVVLFAWVIYLLSAKSPDRNRFQQETARNILSKRYAQGEISKEEYTSMLNGL